MGDYNEYLNDLVDCFWSYRSTRFSSDQTIFDQSDRFDMRPPVLSRNHALRNVLVDPQLSQSEAHQVRRMLPPRERHRWFGSMKSSQALRWASQSALLVRKSGEGRRLEAVYVEGLNAMLYPDTNPNGSHARTERLPIS